MRTLPNDGSGGIMEDHGHGRCADEFCEINILFSGVLTR